MKTLLQINVVANSGSTGHIAEDLGRLAIDNGWRSVIAYGRWAQPSKSELIKIGNKAGIYLHGAKSMLFDKHGLGSKAATKEFVKKIDEIHPDIIHLHNIHGYYINYPILFDYLSKSDIPIIWTLHDCWSFTGHCPHFQNLGCNKWMEHCHDCPSIKQGDYPKAFIDNSYRNFETKKALFTSLSNLTIVPVCEWLNELLSKSFLKSYPKRTILNGIDLNTFRPIDCRSKIDAEYGTKGKFLCLGVATCWNATKGYNDILSFRKELDEDYAIILVGVTKKQKESLPNGIIGIERTENIEKLAELYSAADGVINPTYQDTFPTINIESLACGTPLITYDTGGCKESIFPDTGVTVARGNKEQFIANIKGMKLQGKGRYTNECRLCAEKYFNKNDRYNDYIDLYNRLTNE